MLSKNLAWVAVAFVAEISAAAGPNVLTLCVHEDGRGRYEATLDVCCRQDEGGRGECFSREHRPGDPDRFTDEDSCQDFSVAFFQVVHSGPSIEALTLPSFSVDLLPPGTRRPEASSPPTSSLALDCGPPEGRILRDLSTVVLRI